LILPVGHSSYLKYAAFSNDDKMVITLGDTTSKLWDTESGRLITTLSSSTYGINTAYFSPDNKTIITSQDSTIKVWNAKTGLLITNIILHSVEVIDAEFSPDGKQILACSDDSIFGLFTTNGKCLFVNHLKNISKSRIKSGQFSPDGSKILVITYQSHQVYSSTNGKYLYELSDVKPELIPFLIIRTGKAGPDSILLLKQWEYTGAFSPDGKLIATTSRDSSALVWDSSNGKLRFRLKGHKSALSSVVFSADGKEILTTAVDASAKIWDATSGKLLQTLLGHHQPIANANFSPKGENIFTSSPDSTIRVWDWRTGKCISIFTNQGPFYYSSLSHDGKTLIGAIGDYAQILNAATGRKLSSLKGLATPIDLAYWGSDGELNVLWSKNTPIKLDVASGNQDKAWQASDHESFFDVNGSYSLVITKDSNSVFRVRDLASGDVKLTLNNHTKITNVAVDSDAHVYLTSPKEGKSIKFLNSAEGLELNEFTTKERFYLDGTKSRLVISPNGKIAALIDGYEQVEIFDLESSKLRAIVKANHIDTISDTTNRTYWPVSSLSFSPDNAKLLITGINDAGFEIFDVVKNKIVMDQTDRSSRDPKLPLNTGVYSWDDSMVATGAYDGTIEVWDISSGHKVASLRGHAGTIKQLIFSKDDSKIVSISADKSLKVWNIKKKKLLFTFLAIDSTDYLVTDPYGRYDGTEGARKLLYFTCGTEVIGLDQVKDQLWVPNLAERIMKGDSINAKKLSDLDICGLIPRVEKEDKSGYHFMITPQRGGLGETVIYVNGIEEKRYSPSQLTKTGSGYELNLDEKQLAPYFIAGQQNPVTVKAYTANNDISSRGAEIIQDETKKKGVAPNLYAVMIGVSDYKGPELQLKYAAKDAEDISAAISASAKKLLDTTGGKEHVFMYNLTTGKNHYELPEKIAIKNVFGEIGKKATANDILLIFFAGHGVTSGEKKQFYFLTADASQSSATDAPSEVGISTKELSEWMQPTNIKAQKRILILDACNSGQAINELVKVGADGQNYLAARNDDKAEQIKAIDKLNEKSGLFILAASASNQSAYEMGRYSQGLLTYSLLKAIKQQPDILEDNKYLNVSRWFNAAEKTVSDMVRETGNRQEPQIVSAGNFNIGVVDQEVMAGIMLADEKPLFTASKFLNLAVEDDDLDFSNLIDQSMNEIAARGSDSQIAYVTASNSPEAWSLSGGYEVKGDEIVIKVNVKQNKEIKNKLELTGKKSELKALAEKVVNEATDWIVKAK